MLKKAGMQRLNSLEHVEMRVSSHVIGGCQNRFNRKTTTSFSHESTPSFKEE
jgi:hypothetical protein